MRSQFKLRQWTGPRQWLRLLMVLACGALCLQPTARASGSQWGAGYVPNVPVIDQNGRELKFYDDVIKDRIVVVSFIYTVCKDMCSLVTARLALLQDKLGDLVGRDIHFVSISIDPVRDTPERLKDYATAFGVGPGWTFLTGKPEDIDQIRYKLGERSQALTEHRNEILLGNDRTGDWARDSAFADLVVLSANVRNMDPDWLHGARAGREAVGATAAVPADRSGSALFAKTCGSCHTIGKGNRVGPDLAGLLQRRDRAWVERYLAAPEKMRADKDPTALELAQRFRTVRMPNLSLSEHDIADVMHYLIANSPASVQTAKTQP